MREIKVKAYRVKEDHVLATDHGGVFEGYFDRVYHVGEMIFVDTESDCNEGLAVLYDSCLKKIATLESKEEINMVRKNLELDNVPDRFICVL